MNAQSIEINHNEFRQTLFKIWKEKISLNVTGTVGIGKSVTVYEVAK